MIAGLVLTSCPASLRARMRTSCLIGWTSRGTMRLSTVAGTRCQLAILGHTVHAVPATQNKGEFIAAVNATRFMCNEALIKQAGHVGSESEACSMSLFVLTCGFWVPIRSPRSLRSASPKIMDAAPPTPPSSIDWAPESRLQRRLCP